MEVVFDSTCYLQGIHMETQLYVPDLRCFGEFGGCHQSLAPINYHTLGVQSAAH